MFIELTSKSGDTTIALNVFRVETILQDYPDGCVLWFPGGPVNVKESFEQIRAMIPSAYWPGRGSIKEIPEGF